MGEVSFGTKEITPNNSVASKKQQMGIVPIYRKEVGINQKEILHSENKALIYCIDSMSMLLKKHSRIP